MLASLRRWLDRRSASRPDPAEVARRVAERKAAEAQMRHEIEEASLYLDQAIPGSRPSRFVR
jgi:hypothetical protein